jgi:hypothetical protein
MQEIDKSDFLTTKARQHLIFIAKLLQKTYFRIGIWSITNSILMEGVRNIMGINYHCGNPKIYHPAEKV